MGARPSSFQFTKPGRLRLYSTTELLSLPDPKWLIKDVLPAGGLIGLYGEPGHGKSFVAIDMAMAVATGLPWIDHETQKGLVLYVAAEGGTGIKKRVWAWLDSKQLGGDAARVAWLTEALPMNGESADLDILFERINNEIEEAPTLVIIDTLARCFEGDENMQEDMGRFIAGVDRLRRDFGATVIVVHHTRLDAGRERGSTAFRGAADTMVYVKKDSAGDITISCNKQKDSEEFSSILVRLKAVPERDSCVIAEPQLENTAAVRKILKDNAHGLQLKEVVAHAKGLNISPATVKRKLVSLLKNHEIIKENGLYHYVVAQSKKG